MTLDFPFAGLPAVAARVKRWQPIAADGSGDIAILAFPQPVQLPPPVPLYSGEQLWGHRFQVWGFPHGNRSGAWCGGELLAKQGTRWLQLQGDADTPPIVEGFSGSPVWDDQVGAVVGMTVAADVNPETTTAYLIPAEDLIAADESLLPNPYRGLAPLGEADAQLFYGRNEDIARVVEAVRAKDLVAIVGPSGVGKSSLLRAGVVPALRRAGMAVLEDKDGTAPPAGSAADVVLAVDQFEELVHHDPDTARQRFAQLVEFARQPNKRVLLTLRWDCVDELSSGQTAAALTDGMIAVTPLGRSQLRSAILGPAAHAPGLRFEDGLVERILDEASAEPGQLPLVASLLEQLWYARSGTTLTWQAYRQLGGVRGAVAQRAEAAMAAVVHQGAHEAEVARLFRALVRPTDTVGFVRKAARWADLDEYQQRLAVALASARMLVIDRTVDGETTVDLAHDALIQHRPRLRQWVDSDREFLQWRSSLERRRRAWLRAGRDENMLPSGQLLATAQRWYDERRHDLSPAEWEFVELASRRSRRSKRRRQLVTTGLCLLLAVSVVLASFFVYQRRVSAEQAALAESRELAARSQQTSESDRVLSMKLALAAYQRHPTAEAEQALFHRYLESKDAEAVLWLGAKVNKAEASADGRVIAASGEGVAVVWHREKGRTVRHRLPGTDGVRDVAVASDGSAVLAVGRRQSWLVDPRSGKVRHTFPVDETEKHGWGRVADDGTVLLYTSEKGLKVWRQKEGKYQLAGLPEIKAFPFWVAPDGSQAIVRGEPYTSDQSPVSRVDLRTGEQSDLGRIPASDFVVSRTGTVAYCGGAGVVVERDGKAREMTSPAADEAAVCSAVAIDDAGTTVVSDSLVVSVETAKTTRWSLLPSESTEYDLGTEDHAGLEGLVRAGERVYAVQTIGRRIVLTEVPTAGDQPDNAAAAVVTTDGRYVVTYSEDGSKVRVRETATGKVTEAERDSTHLSSIDVGQPRPFDLSPDGKYVADRVSPTTVQIWTLPALEPLATIEVPPEGQTRFDEQRFVTVAETTVTWWDVRTGKRIRDYDVVGEKLVGPTEEVRDIVPLGEDRLAVVADRSGLVVAGLDGKKIEEVPVGPDATAVEFQQSTPYALVLKKGQTLELWDVRAKRQVGRPLTGVGQSDEDAVTSTIGGLVVEFLAEPGAFVVADDGGVRWYRPGSAVPYRTLRLGASAFARQPLSLSVESGRLLYREVDDTGPRPPSEARLDPHVWYAEVCAALDGQDFTPEERRALPEGVGEERLCPR